MTDIGYTLLADQYIQTINDAYGTDIPLAPLSDFLQNNGAFTTSGLIYVDGMGWEISPEAAQQIQMFAPALWRRTAVGH
jgi:hypothetical protein